MFLFLFIISVIILTEFSFFIYSKRTVFISIPVGWDVKRSAFAVSFISLLSTNEYGMPKLLNS